LPYPSRIFQSNDGNLVLYDKSPGSYTDNVLWAANMEWDGPPGPAFHENYAKVTQNGFLQLVGIDYQHGDETVYFSKKLHSGGATCFTVEFDSIKNDMVAVPCDGSGNERFLRGHLTE